MVAVIKCPVCGAEVERDYYTDCVGLVEDHILCKECGYFVKMEYGPTIEGVVIPNGMSREELSSLYGDKIEKLHLQIYTSDEAEFL